jgi:ABC-2 type transport system ATP-binding protein
MSNKHASVIRTEGLTRYYGRRVGAEEIELDVPAGQIFGFLGPNGAGKTTTIRLLLGYLRPTRGSATIFGHNCWKSRAQNNRDIGYLPGDVRLYPWLTLRKGLRISGWTRHTDLRESGRELSEQFRLEMDLPVRKMSRGMRQKLGLILALAHKPGLLILDEPTSGLDPLIQDELYRLLQQWAQAGHTVFFSSHTLSEVEQLCDHVAIVQAGRIVANERLDLLRQHASRAVTLLFRESTDTRSIMLPEFLRIESQAGRKWECELSGPAPPLIEWAATQPLSDMTIGPPSLETLFRRYYREQQEEL